MTAKQRTTIGKIETALSGLSAQSAVQIMKLYMRGGNNVPVLDGFSLRDYYSVISSGSL